MHIKRLLAGSAVAALVVAGAIAVGLASAEFGVPACACGSVNEEVVADLDQLDRFVQEYAAGHGGLFPTYEALRVASAREDLTECLTPFVDLATGTFAFTPGREDAGTVGYAVSADQRQYLLIGIGLTIRYRHTYLYGLHMGSEIAGYECPILHPGDDAPEPSPPPPSGVPLDW